MTKKSMKIALMLIAAVMIVSIAFAGAASAEEPEGSGTCGDHLTWAYYNGNNTLVITGTGDMDDFIENVKPVPWGDYGMTMQSVSLPEGLTHIGNNAFHSCNMSTISIPVTVTSIGIKAFADSKLTSVEIPANVTTIGSLDVGDQMGAFSSCEKLTSVTFQSGSKLTMIGDDTFSNSKLEAIKIPANVTTIGDYAFHYCFNLSSVTIQPDSKLTKIGKDAFNEIPITEFSIPPTVTTIGAEAFDGTGLTSVEIPANVTTIGKSAFKTCLNLTTVTFQEDSKLTEISEDSFTGTGLMSVEIPANVTTIGSHAFEDCQNLTTVTFQEDSKLTEIESAAFSGTGLTSVKIPANVTKIGESADSVGVFEGCDKLKEVTFPADSKLELIGFFTFRRCTALSHFEIPANVTTIGYQAFNECENLTEVTFPANSKLSDIYYIAFANSGLEKVVINGTFPDSAKFYNMNPGMEVFANCPKFTVVAAELLQTPAVMANFTATASTNDVIQPVWYVSEPQDQPLSGDYEKFYMAFLNGGTLNATFVQKKDSDGNYILPTRDNVTKPGSIFAGWVDADGNKVTNVTQTHNHAFLQWNTLAAEIVENGEKYMTVNDAFNATDATNKTVRLLADSTLTGEITVNKEVILNLSGRNLTAAENRRMFTVEDAGNLTIRSSDDVGTLIGNGTVKVNGGIIWIKAGKVTLSPAVLLFGGNATNGGAVAVESNGTFTMNGGAIILSTAKYGGGVHLWSGTFTMNDGLIWGCNASICGGGVDVRDDCTFDFNGGNISLCLSLAGNGGGISNNGTFTMSSASNISLCAAENGGAVYNEDTFTMNGGNIVLCGALGNGGGVYNSGAFTMEPGSAISICGAGNNQEDNAVNGGGVYIEKAGTFAMNGGDIYHCGANFGGGVHLWNGTFTMLGGNITDCRAYDTGSFGGGVDVREDGRFEVGNTVNISGNTKGKFTANNVRLASGKTLFVIAPLSNAVIGVTTEDSPTDNVPVNITNASSIVYAANFVSDHPGYLATYNTSTQTVQLTLNSFDITYIQPTGGSVAGAENAAYGSTVEVTVTTDSGYTFKELTVTENGSTTTVKSTGNTFTMPAFDVNVTAVFEKNSQPYTPTHHESGQTVIQQQAPVQDVSKDPTPANQATADVTVKYVSQSVLGTSASDVAAIKQVSTEAAAQMEIALSTAQAAGIPLTNSKGAKAVVVTDQNIPNVEKVTFSRVYEISPANAGEKLTKVTVKVPKSDITAKGLTSDDVTVYHFLEAYNIWVPLDTISMTQDENNYYYTAATDGTSPFGVLVKKIGETSTPTAKPTATQTQKSPAPFVGLIAGLGAALVIARMRR